MNSRQCIKLRRDMSQTSRATLMTVLFDGAMIISIQPADHKAGVASAGAKRNIARIGDHHIAAVNMSGEVGSGAPGKPGANHQEVNFALDLLGALPMGNGHFPLLVIAVIGEAKKFL